MIIFSLLIVVFGCSKEESSTVLNKKDKKKMPSQEGFNSKLFITKGETLQAVLKYGHMLKYENSKIVYLDEGVEMDFFDSKGRHTTHLTAESGEYHEDTEDVIGRGRVVVVSDSGVTLHTEELFWDNSIEKIYSDTLIMITTNNYDTLYGKGFESNPDLSKRVIYEPWGVSSERVDMKRVKQEFSNPPGDTLIKQDSIRSKQSR